MMKTSPFGLYTTSTPNWPCTEQLRAARNGPFSQILSHIIIEIHNKQVHTSTMCQPREWKCESVREGVIFCKMVGLKWWSIEGESDGGVEVVEH